MEYRRMLSEHEQPVRIEAEVSYRMAAFGRTDAAHHGCH